MKKYVYFLFCMFIFHSCDKEKLFDGPNYFEDNFESYASLNDALLPDETFWSFTQLTNEFNRISVDTTHALSGKKSLKFDAKQSNNELLSKCSIAKQNMAFWEGETIRISAWYFIQGNHSLNWLFLMDIEERTPIGAGPGMRLALVDNKLRIEYKFNEKDVTQALGQEVDFPRDQWVELILEIKLSQQNKGSVMLWQNGQRIIESQNNRTLPKDLLYFQQGTKGMYSSCEIGITANSKDTDLILWVDDIKFEKVH